MESFKTLLLGTPPTRTYTASATGLLTSANNLSDVADPSTAFTNIKQAATTSATGVVELATQAEVVAGTDTSRAVVPVDLAYSMALRQPAPRPGLISAGTSAAGTTQDNTGLAFATGDLTIGAWVRLDDWTPSTNRMFWHKYSGGNLGAALYIVTTGVVRLGIGNGSGTTNYDSTVATGLADGAWAFISVTVDRDGNATFYVNGAQLGTAVSIAAQSAQTLTNTAAMYWGSDGTNHRSGTFGETFIVSGLLSASRIADIYRAGSIAPFCAYTANTTTGQNTATVDGLSFFQWLDFGQGYGPIIRDRSGNNQHALMGTSGLTHAVPRNPPGIPQRAPMKALVVDGSNSTVVRSTLNTQNPGTGDMSVWWDGIFPSNASGGMLLLSSGSDSSPAGAFALNLNTTALDFFLRGATVGDFTRYRLIGFQTLLAGKRGVVALTRSGATAKLYVGLDGDFFEVSSLASVGTGGTPPAWSTSISGTYFGVGYSGGAEVANAPVFDARLANVAMTEAQLRTEYQRGEPGPEWRGATKTGLVTGDNSTFASDTGFWDDNAVTIAAGKATFTTAGVSYIRRIGSLVAGKRYRVGFTISNYVAAMDVGDNVSTYATYTANGTYTLEFTATGVNLTFRYGQCDLDDVTLEQLGYTTRLRTDTAAGLTALNGAKSSTNDSTDFLFSTTGVTTSPDGRRQIIRPGTLTFTSPGTLNLQLFGASVVDTASKWRIVNVSGTSNASVNLSLGSASGGTQYVNAQAVTAADFDIGTFASRNISGANLWLASSNTATITDLVVVLEKIN